MTTYTIEISGYPQEFMISATDEQSALLEAQTRWYEKMNGASIYETTITNEEAHEEENHTCAGCLLTMKMRSDDSVEVLCGNRKCQFFKMHEVA